MSEYTERAIENLTNYQAPLDPDGIKVAVSREALEVALDEIQSLRQQLEKYRVVKNTIFVMEGCSSHSCFINPPKGFGINGPCRCNADRNKMYTIMSRLNALKAIEE